ncbi:MAG TPA: hypothetical protein VFJ90_00085 [Candidatus Didemnitutus sp.]|nr:hypothetical protein [Candidatus Didemnitutus sp.]
MLKSLYRFLLASGLAALLGVCALAQEKEGKEAREYQVQDTTSEALGKFRVASEAKNQDSALEILDSTYAKLADKTSFDAAVILQLKAQTLLQKSEYSKAIEPLERCLQLSDSHTPTFFDDRVTIELLNFLGQLYLQEAMNNKNPATASAQFDKAETYMARWVKSVKKPTPDGLMAYASLLYNRATQDSDHPDKAGLKRTLEVVERALHLSAHPKDNLYLLKLVCLQGLDRNAEATELLELLVRNKPDSKTYWQQLAALYLQQNNDIRAITAIERAQANGLMNSPKDNYNLVGIHFNLNQYERATELLEKGLKDGGIEADEKNWELLAYCYQQLHQDLKAIDALQRATKAFPKSGQLEFLIAQNYYQLEKNADALKHAQAAVQKGGGNKPASTLLFLAYVAYEQKNFDVALDAATKACAMPEGAKDGPRMLSAIKDAIADREAKKSKM